MVAPMLIVAKAASHQNRSCAHHATPPRRTAATKLRGSSHVVFQLEISRRMAAPPSATAGDMTELVRMAAATTHARTAPATKAAIDSCERLLRLDSSGLPGVAAGDP